MLTIIYELKICINQNGLIIPENLMNFPPFHYSLFWYHNLDVFDLNNKSDSSDELNESKNKKEKLKIKENKKDKKNKKEKRYWWQTRLKGRFNYWFSWFRKKRK